MTNVTFDDEMGRVQRALAQCEDMVARLREPDRARSRSRLMSFGQTIYETYCASCHAKDGGGA